MKKIMFNDKYGLTDAVLQGRKTMTRRLMKPQPSWVSGDGKIYNDSKPPTYKVGEEVAVAQCYEDAILDMGEEKWNKTHKWYNIKYLCHEKGLHNKMFVRADLMPHQIRITDIKVERLKDISDEDCLKEGISERSIRPFRELYCIYTYPHSIAYSTPRDAYANLIEKVAGKGTWERNPWVFAYTFELVR